MKIERNKVLDEFKSYTSNYDVNDPKVDLKLKHTYRVAGLAERIAKSLELSQDDVDLAWLLGMLHDIGRFEQVRIYNTYNDSLSVDHAKFGADLLFGKDRLIEAFVDDRAEDELINNAISVHSLYRVPEELDDRTTMFAHILRDADKLDILKANLETPLEDIYNVTSEELYNSLISDEVVNSFYEHHATLRALKKTPADHVVAHMSLFFELVYKESSVIALEQGYWEQLADFPFANEDTRNKLGVLKEELKAYLVSNQ